MVNKNSEEIFFYLDLTKDYIKEKNLVKLIENYIEKRTTISANVDFGVLIFDKEGSPVFISKKRKPEKINELIEQNWEDRSKTISLFEKGLFYILSYITESIRNHSKAYRIITLSDTPSDLSEDYQKALFNIISKVKYFPTYIDIIRLSNEEKRFFKDVVKLNILVSDTKGGIFYVKNKKELKSTLNRLINPKNLVNTFINKPDQIEISNEDLLFYTRLAQKLKEPRNKEDLVCYLCNKEICPVCLDVYDIPKMCEGCGGVFHNCCILDYSVNNNIGIPFIVRCPQCGLLLQLEKEDYKSEEELGEKDQKKAEESEKFNKKKINLNKVSPPEPIDFKKNAIKNTQNKSISHKNLDDIKFIKIGGFFGKTYKVIKKNEKLIYKKSGKQIDSEKREKSPHNVNQISKQEKKIEKNDNNNENEQKYWSPPKLKGKSEETENNSNLKYNVCSVCGSTLSKNLYRCPNCGSIQN